MTVTTRPTRGLGRPNPQQITYALTAALFGAGVLLESSWTQRPVLSLGAAEPATLVGLVVMFFLAEQILLNVEFRRQAHSLTLAGVPLALTVLVAPTHMLVPIRVGGALAAFLFQRVSLDKMLYNLAAYAFEISLTGLLVRALVGRQKHLELATFLVLLTVMLLVDQVMSAFVLMLIRLHNGPLARGDAAGVLVPAALLSVVSGGFAAAILMLIELGGILGGSLVVVITAVAAVAYRGYVLATRRHQSLQLVQSFVNDSAGADSVLALAEQLLIHIRTLLNASSAELQVFDAQAARHFGVDADGTGATLRLIVAEDDALRVEQQPTDPTDWLTLRARSTGEPILLSRSTKDRAIQAWLQARDLRDAVMVSVRVDEHHSGLIVVTGRLGETATFTADDITLLETLTGHVAVALQSTRLVERLSYEASHDSLTGLHNRAHLVRAIEQTHEAGAGRSAVLLLDLDGFKEVNDTLGHDAGDRLLKVVAERIRRCSPPDAVVTRLGGDEFAVLLPAGQASMDRRLAVTEAVRVAETISAALAEPVHLAEGRLDPRASIGVALDNGDDDVLRQADTAMYAAKAGRRHVTVYSYEMDRERVERLELLTDLRTALRNDPAQFLVYYQPKVDLDLDAVTSAEALVRWQHPRLGFVGPDQFIPLAESTGLIGALTPLVLDASIAECARWNADGHAVSVAVNLSARNIEDPMLPAMVADALRAHDLDPARLILEITESSAMGDPEQTMPVLHQLNDLGVSLSLDDFGTGYSSLAYLQRLPVKEVKIDRSFVLGLVGSDPGNSRALIRSITGLSHSLKLRVVAEGVEDAGQLQELRDLGCDLAQGYYISRPLAATDLHRWLDAHRVPGAANLRLLPATGPVEHVTLDAELRGA